MKKSVCSPLTRHGVAPPAAASAGPLTVTASPCARSRRSSVEPAGLIRGLAVLATRRMSSVDQRSQLSARAVSSSATEHEVADAGGPGQVQGDRVIRTEPYGSAAGCPGPGCEPLPSRPAGWRPAVGLAVALPP